MNIRQLNLELLMIEANYVLKTCCSAIAQLRAKIYHSQGPLHLDGSAELHQAERFLEKVNKFYRDEISCVKLWDVIRANASEITNLNLTLDAPPDFDYSNFTPKDPSFYIKEKDGNVL